MTNARSSRREFAGQLASYVSGLGIAGTMFASRGGAQGTRADEEISRTAESIHQEVMFKASRQRVYEVLTDGAAFERVVKASDAMKGGMPPGAKPAAISHEAGGVFSLFAGLIVGRNIEMIPNQRLVQAWRAEDWKPGHYSIVRFELSDAGSGTKLVFDHAGFPTGEATHLLEGWNGNYWRPIVNVLG
jgi:activator of HSP90 ATPase